MLGGSDPILIFSFFKKLTPEQTIKFKDLPVEKFINSYALPPIPIYLSEQATGLFVESKSKNIDIETTVDAIASGGDPNYSQRAINSVVKVEMQALKSSTGLAILSAFADLVLPKVTSGEYSIIYLDGATTIFGGLLHSFAVDEENGTNKSKVTIEFIKTSKKGITEVPKDPGSVDLNNVGSAPAGGASGFEGAVPKIPSLPIPGAG